MADIREAFYALTLVWLPFQGVLEDKAGADYVIRLFAVPHITYTSWPSSNETSPDFSVVQNNGRKLGNVSVNTPFLPIAALSLILRKIN